MDRRSCELRVCRREMLKVMPAWADAVKASSLAGSIGSAAVAERAATRYSVHLGE